MIQQRNKSIQLIRIVAMFMIMFDHIITFINVPGKSVLIQLTNAGTIIFVFVSGLLFGERMVDNWFKWIKRRTLRICLPMWIVVLCCIRLEQIIWGINEWKKGIIYIFNVQGVFGGIKTGAHLWFLTLIMVCYFLTPIFSIMKKKIISRYLVVAVCIGCILQLTVSCFCDIKLASAHSLGWWMLSIIVYFIGYMWGQKIIEFFGKNKRMIILIAESLIVGMITVLLRNNIGNSIVYNKAIIFYCLVNIELCICVIVYYIGKIDFPNIINSVINIFDSVSYEMYLVHIPVLYFITISMIKHIGSVPYVVVTLVMSFVISIILSYICKFILNLTQRKTKGENNQ